VRGTEEESVEEFVLVPVGVGVAWRGTNAIASAFKDIAQAAVAARTKVADWRIFVVRRSLCILLNELKERVVVLKLPGPGSTFALVWLNRAPCPQLLALSVMRAVARAVLRCVTEKGRKCVRAVTEAGPCDERGRNTKQDLVPPV